MSHWPAGRILFTATFVTVALLPSLLRSQSPPGYSEVHPIYEGDFDPSRYGLSADPNSAASAAEAALRAEGDKAKEILPELEAILKFGEIGDYREREAAMLHGRCAVRYIELRQELAPTEAEWFRQSVGALEAFNGLLTAVERHDVDTHLGLVEEIMRQYPESVFVEFALLASCIDHFDQLLKQSNRHPLNASMLFDPYFDMIKRHDGSIERSWHFIHYFHCHATVRLNHNPQVLRDDIRFSKNPYLRRSSFAELIKHAARQNEDNLTQLTEAFLAEHCPAHLSAGRRELIRHLLIGTPRSPNEHMLANAQWWIGQWNQAGHLADAFDAEKTVAWSFVRQGNVEECIVRYEALLAKAPSQEQLIELRLGLAGLYPRVDRTEEALPILTEIAAIPRVEITIENMDVNGSQDRACQMLAEHFMRQGEWGTAWRYLQEWDPRSWCGSDGPTMTRNRMIKECKKHLPEEATTPSA